MTYTPPQPVKVQTGRARAYRRTTGDVFRALGALLLLVLLLGAIPFALVHFIGWPLPHQMPTADSFRQPLNSQVLLKALAVVVWLAWAQFTACVLVELANARRGVGIPAKVPGAAPSQFLARQLVAALLMLTATAASFAPDIAHLASTPAALPRSQASISAQLDAAGPQGAAGNALALGGNPTIALAAATTGNLPSVRAGSAVARPASATMTAVSVDTVAGTKLYRVQPPHGRSYDSLWEIAERHLGDGRRYKEIFALNKDRIQPDGQKLTDASLIRPGWILEMPADATGGDLITEMPAAASMTTEPAASTTTISPTAATQLNTPVVGGVAALQQGGQQGIEQGASVANGANGVNGVSGANGVNGSGGEAASVTTTDSEGDSNAATVTMSTAQSPDTLSPGTLSPDTNTSANAAVDAAANAVAGVTVDSASTSTSTAEKPEVAEEPAEQSEQPADLPASEEQADRPPIDQPAAEQPVADHPAAEQPDQPPAAEPASGPTAGRTGFAFDGSATASSKLTPANPQGVKVSQAAEDIAQAVAAAARAAEASEAAQHNGDAGDASNAGGPIVGTALMRTSHRGSASADERQLGPVEERVLYGIAGAPLMAAGLLLALGRHRRRQLWNRIGGRRPTTPTGDAAVAEESIRVGAGEVEVWFLDLALRGLSAELAKRGRSLPRAHALRLRSQGIELMLAETAEPTGPDQAPLPWFGTADGRSWNFPRVAIGQIDAEAAHQRFAPYPGLVSLGTSGRDGEDRILIDLEDTPGVLALAGSRAQTRALISAMAVELATNAWSDRMSVTLVGFPGDLTPLAPARVRHVKTLEDVLPVLESEAADRAAALSGADLDSILDSRVRPTHVPSFAPHFVLIAEEPSPELLDRLVRIAPSTTRVGMGFVVVGDVQGAAGRLEIGEDGTVRESRPGGLEVTAQVLPEDQYAAILGLFRAVGDVEGVPLSGGGGGVARVGAGYTGPLPDEPPAVFVRVLGELETSGTGMAELERAPLLHEALVFLLQHRDGVHPSVLAAALWPRGTTADVAKATVERLSEWLGTDPKGRPNLIAESDGRLRLGPYVWSDWDLFESLHARALYDVNLQSPVHLDNLLSAALDLVRGRFLANRAKGRYGWLAYEIVEAQIPAQIADTALRLADARVANGAAERAIAAVEAGLRASPEDEELWRGLLRAVFATNDVPRLEQTIASLRERTWRVHGVRELHPRTEALIAELAPSSAVRAG
jgi:Bacterial transcriptional activator domain